MPKAAPKTLIEDYHLLSYDVLDSTNEEARRLAAGGGSHGAVIWARRQSSGRGRMGREWVSAEGNLFVSVLLAPDKPLAECAQLSFVAAVAAAETLEGIVGDREVRCKWPNDVLCDGRKIGGILLEAFTTMDEQGAERPWVVVGVGINVDSFPEHVMFLATCLREAGVELISAKIVLSRFIHHFIAQYDSWTANGFTPTHKAWMQRAYRLGHATQIIVGDDEMQGSFDGIDASGRLLLKQGSKQVPITAGDVFFKD